ncbi:MAG: DUF2225 domain-containing protein [bacterium]
MAVWEDVQLTCPLCLTPFASRVVTQANAIGQDTDGRLHFQDVDPLPTFIHTCPTCKFTASRRAFQVRLESEEIFRARAFLEGMATPETAYERYALMAQVMDQYRKDEPIFPGNAWLTASWCARQEGRREDEHEAQRRAIRWLDENLRLKLAQREERTYLTYLIGELHRRVSEWSQAREYFNAVPGIADLGSKEEKFLVTLSVLQKRYAFDRCHVNTLIPAEFIRRGFFLRHFRSRLDQGTHRVEVSAI